MAMNGLPYYKRYPRDFLEGTVGMEFELKAAYALVLDLIYMQGGELRDDPRYISGLLGMSVRKWNRLREKLLELGKIYVENEFISNFRADKELETLRSFQTKQAENASGPRKNKDLPKPRPNHTEPDTEPEPKKEENSHSANDASLTFKEFWETYTHPKNRGSRSKAESIWRRLTHAERTSALETIPILRKFYEQPDAPFKPMAQTWLGQKRWQDPPEVENSLSDRLNKLIAEEENGDEIRSKMLAN